MIGAQPAVQQFPQPSVELLRDQVRPGEGSLTIHYVMGEPKVISELALGTLRDPRLRVVASLTVSFAEDEGGISARANEIDEFGFGSNYSEALTDLQHTIAELYFSLEEDRDRLGSDLQRVWETLQQKIRRRS